MWLENYANWIQYNVTSTSNWSLVITRFLNGIKYPHNFKVIVKGTMKIVPAQLHMVQTVNKSILSLHGISLIMYLWQTDRGIIKPLTTKLTIKYSCGGIIKPFTTDHKSLQPRIWDSSDYNWINIDLASLIGLTSAHGDILLTRKPRKQQSIWSFESGNHEPSQTALWAPRVN